VRFTEIDVFGVYVARWRYAVCQSLPQFLLLARMRSAAVSGRAALSASEKVLYILPNPMIGPFTKEGRQNGHRQVGRAW
jgi:hypothetical protein